jgi:hypothetical protein
MTRRLSPRAKACEARSSTTATGACCNVNQSSPSEYKAQYVERRRHRQVKQPQPRPNLSVPFGPSTKCAHPPP